MKTKFKNLLKGRKGVSEVVAVLVLVAVVIVGAIGVGVIMNGFSNQVQGSTSADDIKANSGTDLVIAGSTTVKPLSDCLAPAFMNANKAIKVTVQAGGSGIGITSAGMGLVDLGASSEALTTAQTTKWPNLQAKKIGGSAVVFIASTACTFTAPAEATVAELKTAYDGTTGTWSIGGATVAASYARSDASGTADTVAGYVIGSGKKSTDLKATSFVASNQEMLSAIKTASGCAIGFVDHGVWATSPAGTKVVNLTDTTTHWGVNVSTTQFVKALQGDASAAGYPTALTRGLYYISNGNPSIVAQKWIDFASTQASADACFVQTGYIPGYTIEKV